MSALERLQLIASTLPQESVEALIQVAQHMSPRTLPISAEDLQRRLDAAPFEDVDAETAAELDAALREAQAIRVLPSKNSNPAVAYRRSAWL